MSSVRSIVTIGGLVPRPLVPSAEAWSELDDNLMMRRLPGVFAAGEMIDWEAPTGGFLLQGCFATATRAAEAALRWLDHGRE